MDHCLFSFVIDFFFSSPKLILDHFPVLVLGELSCRTQNICCTVPRNDLLLKSILVKQKIGIIFIAATETPEGDVNSAPLLYTFKKMSSDGHMDLWNCTLREEQWQGLE